MLTKTQESCVYRMDRADRLKLLFVALERLIELEEIGFRMDGEQEDGEDEYFYWKASGEDLLNSEESP